MNIKKKAIVSNSEMIKSYKACRAKAESMGKVFIIKRNHPDAVLFSIDEYEKRSLAIEQQEIAEVLTADKAAAIVAKNAAKDDSKK